MKPLFSFFGRAGGLETHGKNQESIGRRRAFRFNLFEGSSTALGTSKRISTPIPHAIVSATALLFSINTFAQQPQDTTKTEKLDEVIVQSVRATSKTPVTFSNMKKEEFEKRNLGQDIPQLLNFLPSVVTTSDAGNSIGYSGIRVRGTDATRVNVTINGVPYNDAESMGTFWVNMPDFASSTENLQLQRGVGTSTNGSGAFGASLNVLTDSYSEKANGEISNSFGSFNTRKHTVKFSTGLLGDHFELAGRLSNIESDGYIDRAFSSLKSYFLQGTYVNKGTLIKALVFGGKEKTYQSWNGLEDPEKLRDDRTYNTAGEYVDDNGLTRFYDNQTDNYQQDHYQLHWTQKWSDAWSSTAALHYTIGKGYYENYRTGESVSDYGIEPQVIDGNLVDETDLIDQKWLDNDFYGGTFSVNYRKGKVDAILGGGWNEYDGDHYGKVLWTRNVVLPMYGQRYYSDRGVKKDGNIFAKANYQVIPKLNLFADLQYRRVGYDANSPETGFVHDRFDFFNPKAGATYSVNDRQNIYASYARANREPNRTDYENGNPRPEQLDDFELGWRYASAKAKVNVNAYYMKYNDQLVLTGALDNVGAPIRENSGKSYRLGLEVEAAVAITDKWSIRPNVTVSTNKNQDFVFQRDGVLTDLGDTNIAFSPNVVAANAITFAPTKNFQVTLLSKFVGEQYMGNIDSETSKLDSYATSDLSVSYEWKNIWFFRSILASGLVNNIFDYEYESNGYFYTYDDDFSNPGTVTTVEGAGFYPQAGINFLAGLTLKF
ncbi:TonB-dependent receptor [Flavobacterium sp. MAH-1]|uniref:TonB-dependent receptor n=1 Tax=Flavobacterium agri TaxID=2743471 RepID=A0A7Y8Y598_9FLAO|nr:TonB-dependent receptor [Flavobacterium agri]NUY81516.1 TonB-dependent receptor [Flavobacterium agri]NYA71540.1 TonB-dependent receptor [Flavobacterium agri]